MLCKVSLRFKRLATDSSLWKGSVFIHMGGRPEKGEFVIQECLNSGTKSFTMYGDVGQKLANPNPRFPNLKYMIGTTGERTGSYCCGRDKISFRVYRHYDEDSEDIYIR